MKFTVMDIDAAIAAHKAWRMHFSNVVQGIDAVGLNDLAVADHTVCVLGTWLDAPQQQEFHNLSVFRDILEVHRNFHEAARQIVDLLGNANVDAARDALGRDFNTISMRLILMLEEFKELAPGLPAKS